MMQAFRTRIRSQLEQRRENQLNRQLNVVTRGNQLMIEQHGDLWVNFSSNNYLGLANDSSLIEAWQNGLTLFGAGSSASSLVTGFSTPHLMLEHKLCDWLGYERAILFNSGFSANQAMLFTLLEKGDRLLQDKLNHASLIEAGMLSSASMTRFKHNDVQDLNRKLHRENTPAFIVTEGVFSMDGDCAPLSDIALQIRDGDLWAVDDAHGLGVMEGEGRGSCAAAQVKPDLLIATFGKALGMSGAAIMCNAELGEYLTQCARHHVYSTAMPPAQAYALSHAITLVQTQQWRRDHLDELSEHFHHRFRQFSGCVETTTPIKPVILGDAESALNCAQFMRENGQWVSAIRSPTVAKGTARIRITLTALHQPTHIEALAEKFEQWMDVYHG